MDIFWKILSYLESLRPNIPLYKRLKLNWKKIQILILPNLQVSFYVIQGNDNETSFLSKMSDISTQTELKHHYIHTLFAIHICLFLISLLFAWICVNLFKLCLFLKYSHKEVTNNNKNVTIINVITSKWPSFSMLI